MRGTNDGERGDADERVIRVVGSMGGFTRAEWESLSGTTRGAPDTPYNPFLSFDFLQRPGRIRLRRPQDRLAAASHAAGNRRRIAASAPCPATRSRTARANMSSITAGPMRWSAPAGSYYPKLQAAIPFTPATGPRLLAAQGADAGFDAHGARGGPEGRHRQDRRVVGACHLRATRPTWRRWRPPAICTASTSSSTSSTKGLSTYDDFLATLASRKRKALKKERREAVVNGITIERLTGKAMTEEAWDDFFAFYMDTGSRKWGRPYLNRAFFSLIGERMADDVLLVMARRDGRYIAGAINFIGSDTLYGRNWGCIEDHPFLHFEVCYHQAIDFAIERGLKVVEAGAQGEHKLARGYRPVTTHSAHYISHPGLRHAIADYLDRERREVTRMGDYLEEHAPFRKGEPPEQD